MSSSPLYQYNLGRMNVNGVFLKKLFTKMFNDVLILLRIFFHIALFSVCEFEHIFCYTSTRHDVDI